MLHNDCESIVGWLTLGGELLLPGAAEARYGSQLYSTTFGDAAPVFSSDRWAQLVTTKEIQADNARVFAKRPSGPAAAPVGRDYWLSIREPRALVPVGDC